MTYDALGTLIQKYGEGVNADLEYVMNNAEAYGLERTGFGKVRITDFKTFAKLIGLNEVDESKPEYVEAYSDYLDYRAELENKEAERVEQSIDAIKNLTNSAPETFVNATQFDKILGQDLPTIAQRYGATVEDGLLHITEATDIPGLVEEIANTAANSGELLPEQIAELADAVSKILTDTTSLITNGISGKLN